MSPSMRKAPTADTYLRHTAAVFSMESQSRKALDAKRGKKF